MRILAILAALPLVACSNASADDNPGVAGTGSGNSRSYAVADFTKVDLRGADDVEVRIGNGFTVRAEGDAEVLEYLKVEKDGDTLKVGRRDRVNFSWGDKSAKIFITMPRIAAGSIAGSGDLRIDRVQGSEFEGETAGSGNIAIAALAVDKAEFDIAGSGGVQAVGTAKTVKVDIAGSGGVQGGKLQASGADVSIAGSGSVTLAVTGNAKVTIMGSGSVDLGSKARCSTTKMGSGTVRCGG